MHNIDPNITFEFGPKENGRRKFIISADGIRSAFPAVEKLYSAAPQLPRWTFIKFRLRRPPFDITYERVSVKAAAVVVRVRSEGGKADLEVFIPGFNDDRRPTYTAIVYLLLDQALGEYDVETRVEQILVWPIENAPRDAVSLAALPVVFDRLTARK